MSFLLCTSRTSHDDKIPGSLFTLESPDLHSSLSSFLTDTVLIPLSGCYFVFTSIRVVRAVYIGGHPFITMVWIIQVLHRRRTVFTVDNVIIYKNDTKPTKPSSTRMLICQTRNMVREKGSLSETEKRPEITKRLSERWCRKPYHRVGPTQGRVTTQTTTSTDVIDRVDNDRKFNEIKFKQKGKQNVETEVWGEWKR